tara:strand:+ start:25 stop:225 length:201 start_codon:yes stop_codon:yes gene_type:complete
MNFDHIGIFVKNSGNGLEHSKDMFPIASYNQHHQYLLKVIVQFFDELATPNGNNNSANSLLLNNRK